MKRKIMGIEVAEDWIPPPSPCIPHNVVVAEDLGVSPSTPYHGSSNIETHTNSTSNLSPQLSREQTNIPTPYE